VYSIGPRSFLCFYPIVLVRFQALQQTTHTLDIDIVNRFMIADMLCGTAGIETGKTTRARSAQNLNSKSSSVRDFK
jgi:hypothetical protein